MVINHYYFVGGSRNGLDHDSSVVIATGGEGDVMHERTVQLLPEPHEVRYDAARRI